MYTRILQFPNTSHIICGERLLRCIDAEVIESMKRERTQDYESVNILAERVSELC